MLIEVKPLPLKKWHGKEGKDDISQGTILEVLVDSRTHRYATGLTEEDIKMLKKKMPGVELDNNYIPGKPHSYWSSKAAKIKLPNKTIILDTSQPQEYIKYKNLKASKYVANSIKDWEDGLFPEATHYIYSEEEEVSRKASKVALRKTCYKLLDKLTKQQKISIIQILSNKNVKHMSEDSLDVYIDDIIEKQPLEFIETSKSDKEYLNMKGILYDAMSKNVVHRKGITYYYMGTKLGDDLDSTINLLLSEDGAKLRTIILEKIDY